MEEWQEKGKKKTTQNKGKRQEKGRKKPKKMKKNRWKQVENGGKWRNSEAQK